MKFGNASTRGSVLFVAILFVTIATAVMLAVCQATLNNDQKTSSYIGYEQSYFAAKGMNDMAFGDFWGGYTNSGQKDFSAYLNSKYTWSTTSQGSDTIADEFRGLGTYSSTTTPSTPSNIKITGCDVIKRVDIATNNLGMDSMTANGLRIYRRDRSVTDLLSNTVTTNIDLMIVSQAKRNLGATTSSSTPTYDQSWVAATVTASNQPIFIGFDYAVLTKNLTCTMCHMTVQDLARAKNTDPNKYNTYNRVKIGATEYISCRPSSANSQIQGAIYHRGILADESSGVPMSTATFAGSTITSVAFNTTDNPVTIKQNTSGAVTSANLVNMTSNTFDPVTGASSVAPAANGNLYLHYPNNPTLETDGTLPASSDFPAPFKESAKALVAADNTGNAPAASGAAPTLINNRVDTDEISSTKTNFDTSNTAAGTTAGITGGVATVLTPTSSSGPATMYSSGTLPTTGNVSSITNGTVGNVILTGTATNPIQITGAVVIQGDVILNGYIQGTGQIYATGNVYIPGDLIYNDAKDSNGNEIFGQNASGGANLVSVVAGGNIVSGDYLSQVTHWDSSRSEFYNPRNNGTTPQPGSPDPGYKIPYVPASGTTPESGSQNPYTDLDGMGSVTNHAGQTVGNSNMANFTMEQLAVFNNAMLQKTLPKLPVKQSGSSFDPTVASNYTLTNPFYDSTVVPRYYTMYPQKFNQQNTDPNGTQLNDANGNPLNKADYVPFYLNNGSPWDSTNNRFSNNGDPHSYNLFTELAKIPASVQSPNAPYENILAVHPDWITPNTMMQIISSVQAARPANTPRRMDGLLYTNNAIFTIERKRSQYYNPNTKTWSNVASTSGGQVVVNGAIIAPDLGVLVTGDPNGAFTVNYDARVKSFFLSTQSTTWGYTRQGYTHGSGALP